MNQVTYSQTPPDSFNRNREIFFSVFALALTALSFHGTLDNLAFSKIDQLTKETFGLLLVSRGINAAVSVLQTVEFKIPLVSSAAVGQVLDPINDAVERLSVGLTWAIGPLFLQDILLRIASAWLFKWGYLVVTVMTATTLMLAQSSRIRIAFVTTFGVSHITLAQFQGLLIRTLIVATIFRFIVPTFAVASFLVSQALVAPEIKQHAAELEKHEKGLSQMGAQISAARDEVINEQKSQNEILSDDETGDSVRDNNVEPASASPLDQASAAEDVQAFGEQKVRLEKRLASLHAEKERLTASVDERESSGWTDWIPKFGDDPNAALAEATARVG